MADLTDLGSKVGAGSTASRQWPRTSVGGAVVRRTDVTVRDDLTGLVDLADLDIERFGRLALEQPRDVEIGELVIRPSPQG